MARRCRFIEGGIQAQPCDAGHAPARQRGEQLQGGKAHVGHKHQLALREPTANLQDNLTGPVGELLVALPMLAARALEGRQGGQERQGPGPGGPRDRGQQHQADPAQA
jgi:hypothetical protein